MKKKFPLPIKPVTAFFIFFSCSNVSNADNLYSLFNKAKYHSPHLHIAQAQQEIAYQKINQAEATKEPKLNFIGQEKKGANKTDLNADSKTEYRVQNYALQLSVPLFNKVKNEEILSAKLNEKVAIEQFQTNYNELLINLVESYFKLLNLNSKLELIKQQKIQVLEQKKIANANFNQGMVSITDLKEADAKYTTLLSQENSLNLEIKREKNILSEFIGSKEFVVDVKFPTLSQLPPIFEKDQEQFDQLLLTNNNQIKISKLNLNIAKQEVEKEKAVGYPTINFTSKLSRNFDSQDSAFVAKQDGWDYLYGVEMNLPMYNSENQYKIKELYATLNKNKYELDLNIQKQRTQMHEAFYNTLSAISKTNGMKDAELASEKAWLSNKRAYEVGMRVNAEVLEAQSKYYESKQERLTAWYEAWQNYIKLRSILGLLTDNEIIDIDRNFYTRNINSNLLLNND